MIDAGIRAVLLAAPAINTITTRIYPVVLPPEPMYPAVTYRLITARPNATLNTSGFQKWRMQFDCFAGDYLTAYNLRQALLQTLNGFQGTLGDGTRIQNIDFIQLSDNYLSLSRKYHAMIEFYLEFNLSS